MATTPTTQPITITTETFKSFHGDPLFLGDQPSAHNVKLPHGKVGPMLCNGYAELCGRKFSNVSMVVAHNSPFAVKHNAASNQEYQVLAQLEDGIRGLQYQTHLGKDKTTIHLCHTSCDLLDAGPLLDYLKLVRRWLEKHPDEVLTMIIVNGDRVPPETFFDTFVVSGMLPYLYRPPRSSTPSLTSWPTLAEMIATNQRVVAMIDYGANQTDVPVFLDEFAYLWETPFSPTNSSFPCTQHRPPHQAEAVSRDRMYLMNHNLNVPLPLFGQKILIPDVVDIDRVNAANATDTVSLATNVQHCTETWGRPPNGLLVDFYHRGDFGGSVFEVAARANGVKYVKAKCCGKSQGFVEYGYDQGFLKTRALEYDYEGIGSMPVGGASQIGGVSQICFVVWLFGTLLGCM